MKQCLKFLTQTINIIVLISLCIMIWFGANIFEIKGWHPLQSTNMRLSLIILIIIFWMLLIIIKNILSKNADKLIITNFLHAQYKNNPDIIIKEEFQLLIKDVIKNLKKQRLLNGKKITPLYKLPLYLIIGPPGHGKTSMIDHSGLNHVVNTPKGNENIRIQVKNLGLWITEKAVFLEITRYEKDHPWNSPNNNYAWINILKAFKMYKRVNPIDGVIITTDVGVFFTDKEEIEKRCVSVNQYLNDLHEQLETKFPIYIVNTKCDKIKGFLDYFNNINEVERQQIFGITLSNEENINGPQTAENFAIKYDQLIKCLRDRLLWLINLENNLDSRISLFFFPQQMLLIKQIITETFKNIFLPTGTFEFAQLQGIYFTSAIQDESLFHDLLHKMVKKQFKLPLLHGNLSLNKKFIQHQPYFLRNLFQELIIPRTQTFNIKKQKLKKWLHISAYLVIGLVLLTGSTGLTVGYFYNRSYLLTAMSYLKQCKTIESQFNNYDLDVTNVLPLLNTLRKPIDSYENDPNKWLLSVYFNQTPLVLSSLQHTLNIMSYRLLLPRIRSRLEKLLIQNENQPDKLIIFLKGYLVYEKPNQYPKQWLTEAINFDWTYNNSFNLQVRQQLEYYLKLALQQNLHIILNNQQLITTAKKKLAEINYQHEIYNALKQQAEAQLPAFNLFDVLGKHAASNTFIITPIIIPSLYTPRGRSFYSEKLPVIANTFLKDMVLIIGDRNDGKNSTFQKHIQAVNELYYHDYINEWQTAINKLSVFQAANLQQIYIQLNQLAGSNSLLSKLAIILRANNGNDEVNKYFNTFNTIIDNDNTLSMINELADRLNQIISASNTNEASYQLAHEIMINPDNNILARLHQLAITAPSPIANWLNSLADNIWQIMLKNSQNYVANCWDNTIVKQYKNLSRYYPIDTRSLIDINAMDFGNFFSNNGVFNRFFNDYLKPFIDTSKTPWEWRTLYGHSLSNSTTTLNQLAIMTKATQSFHYKPEENLVINFSITPLTLTANATCATLSVDNQPINYCHGPQQTKNFKWSVTKHNSISFSLENFDRQKTSKNISGPWTLFKLANTDQLSSFLDFRNYNMTLNSNEYNATYQISIPGAILFTQASHLQQPLSL